MRAVNRELFTLFLVSAALGAGCGDGKPRTLPFPQLDARAPFPELAGRTEGAAPGAPPGTSFADRLAPAGPAPAAGGSGAVTARRVPLGSQLSGEIPSDAAWSWQPVEEGVTLIACRPGSARLAALVYAEAFPARMRTAPSEEIQRFQLTVNPEGTDRGLTSSAAAGVLKDGLIYQVARGTGGGRTEAARLLQLLSTRTAGAGLGFRPAAGSFTGWKWVGKNERDVTVRLARSTGTWEPQASLPAEIGQRLEALRKIPALSAAAEQLGSRPAQTGAAGGGGASAYLLVGSATDDSEQSGAHLALLWQHAADSGCVEGLASFLASLRTTGGPGPGPSRSGDGQVSDIPDAAGLRLLPAAAVVPLDQLQAPAAPATQPATPGPRRPSSQ
jgi:hypothetical protein